MGYSELFQAEPRRCALGRQSITSGPRALTFFQFRKTSPCWSPAVGCDTHRTRKPSICMLRCPCALDPPMVGRVPRCGPAGGSPVRDAGHPTRATAAAAPSDLCDKRGSHKSPMHRGPQGLNPGRAPGTTRPRQLSHKSPREPEICSGKESEAVRATRKEEGRGVRAKACGARAVGCSCVVSR